MVAVWIAQLARGILALALGVTITLTLEHTAAFGFISFGIFAVLSSVVLLLAVLRGDYAGDRRFTFLMQAVATLAAGVVALAVPLGGVAFLGILVGAWALLTGLLEGASGILSRGRSALARDWILVGAATVVLGRRGARAADRHRAGLLGREGHRGHPHQLGHPRRRRRRVGGRRRRAPVDLGGLGARGAHGRGGGVVTEPRRPTLRERTRPAEVLGLAAVLSLFVGGAVLFATRDLTLAIVFFGVAFVVAVLMFATLLLAVSKPEPPRDDDRPPAH